MNFSYEWTVGEGSKGTKVLKNACRYFFFTCYDVGHTWVEELSKEIKSGVVQSCLPFSESRAVVRKGSPQEHEVWALK